MKTYCREGAGRGIQPVDPGDVLVKVLGTETVNRLRDVLIDRPQKVMTGELGTAEAGRTRLPP